MLSVINMYAFHIFCPVFHFMHPELCIQLVSLTACASNQILQRLSLYGGNCRSCGGGESAETGLIIIRQDALCTDFGFGANPKSNACLRGSIEKGRLGGRE